MKISIPVAQTQTQTKALLIHYMAWGFIAFMLSFLFSLGTDIAQPGVFAWLFYMACFGAAGYCYWKGIPKEIDLLFTMPTGGHWLNTVILTMFLFFVQLFFFFIAGSNGNYFALSGAVSFALPSAISLGRDYYKSKAPAPVYKSWALPTELPPNKVSIFLNSVKLRLQLSMNAFDDEKKNFVLTVPPRITIGEMFHRFLMDKAAQDIFVQLYDNNMEAFEWKFSLKKEFGTKMLDPNGSIIQNEIRNNAIIIAERVVKVPKVPGVPKVRMDTGIEIA